MRHGKAPGGREIESAWSAEFGLDRFTIGRFQPQSQDEQNAPVAVYT